MVGGLQVTTSVGLAFAEPGSSVDIEALIGAADVQLCRAKSEGRNCVRSVTLSMVGETIKAA